MTTQFSGITKEYRMNIVLKIKYSSYREFDPIENYSDDDHYGLIHNSDVEVAELLFDSQNFSTYNTLAMLAYSIIGISNLKVLSTDEILTIIGDMIADLEENNIESKAEFLK